ncbi:MAG: hypothetical protein ACOCUL_01235, partial [Bacteroidota bacterium]
MGTKESWKPKEEGHHSDCTGKGPANTWILKDGHIKIHQDNAYWAMKASGRKKLFQGFCGDPLTLKNIGNNYYDPSLGCLINHSPD